MDRLRADVDRAKADTESARREVERHQHEAQKLKARIDELEDVNEQSEQRWATKQYHDNATWDKERERLEETCESLEQKLYEHKRMMVEDNRVGTYREVLKQIESVERVIKQQGSELISMSKSLAEENSRMEDFAHSQASFAEQRDAAAEKALAELAQLEEQHRQERQSLEAQLEHEKSENSRLDMIRQHLEAKQAEDSAEIRARPQQQYEEAQLQRAYREELTESQRTVALLRSQLHSEEAQRSFQQGANGSQPASDVKGFSAAEASPQVRPKLLKAASGSSYGFLGDESESVVSSFAVQPMNAAAAASKDDHAASGSCNDLERERYQRIMLEEALTAQEMDVCKLRDQVAGTARDAAAAKEVADAAMSELAEMEQRHCEFQLPALGCGLADRPPEASQRVAATDAAAAATPSSSSGALAAEHVGIKIRHDHSPEEAERLAGLATGSATAVAALLRQVKTLSDQRLFFAADGDAPEATVAQLRAVRALERQTGALEKANRQWTSDQAEGSGASLARGRGFGDASPRAAVASPGSAASSVPASNHSQAGGTEDALTPTQRGAALTNALDHAVGRLERLHGRLRGLSPSPAQSVSQSRDSYL